MNTVIIDDEVFALKRLERLLDSNELVESVDCFFTPKECLVFLESNAVDVAFIDYNLSEMNGLELARIIKDKYPLVLIVFITAHDMYATDAFEMKANDYILKPYDAERLNRCVDRLNEIVYSKSISEKSLTAKIIPLLVNGEVHLKNIEDIYYIESVDKMTQICTKTGFIRSSKSLKFYEDKYLAYPFFKSHRRFIVNLRKINCLELEVNSNYCIRFREIDYRATLSRQRVKVLKELLIE